MEDRPQSIFDHLSELRRRIIWSLLFLVAAISVMAFYADNLFKLILSTANQGLSSGHVLIVQTNFSDTFMAQFRLAILVGIIIAFPFVLYQVIAFVLPALRPSERRLLWIGLPFATVMYLLGWAFSWFVVIPLTKDFFMGVSTSAGVQAMITPSAYIDFVLGIGNPMGISFELPLLVLILARIGLVTSQLLVRIRKIMVMVILVLAAVLSPPDLISLTVFFIPLYGLYEFSIVLARFAGKKRE